jgi:hypothetical protein
MNIEETYYGLRSEVKAKNSALADLITQVAASYEVKCHMCEAAIAGTLTVANFKERHNTMLPENLRESDSQRTVKKHAGRADNFVEGNPFLDHYPSREISEVEKPAITAKKEQLVESTMRSLKLDENGARAVLGLKLKKPAGYEQLTGAQRKDFDFAVACNISESDAFTLARLNKR